MKNKICVVTMIRAPLKDTLNFVNYHLNIGVDHIYMLLDNPKDEALEALKKNNRVTCLKGDTKYWKKLTSDPKLIPILKEMRKGKNIAEESSSKLVKSGDRGQLVRIEKQELSASYVLGLARKNGYNWIVHLDSDELIYIEGSLKKLISRAPKNIDVLRLTALEAVPEQCSPDNIFLDTTLFKSMGGISRFYYNNKKILQKLLPLVRKHEGNISGLYFNGHAAGKSIVRTASRIKIVGIHEPAPEDGYKLAYAFPSNGYLLHFDSCSFDEWKIKCLRKYDGTVIAVAMKKKGVELLEKFIKAHKSGNENKMRSVYEEEFFIPKGKKVFLFGIGLLRRIRIDKKLFLTAKNL